MVKCCHALYNMNEKQIGNPTGGGQPPVDRLSDKKKCQINRICT